MQQLRRRHGRADSAAATVAAGGNPLVAAAITGSGSAAQSARAAHEAGADDMTAMQYGAAIGAVEGLSGMVDVGTMTNAYRSARGGVSQGARNFLLGQLANAGAQGLSEGLTQAAEIALADGILGEYSENNALRAQMRAAGASEAEIERAIRSLNAARVGQAALSGALLGPVFDVGGRLVGGAVNAATGHAPPQMGAGGDSSRGFSLRPEDGLSSLYDFAPAEGYNPSHYWALPDDVAQAAVPGRAQQQAQSAMQEAPRLTVRMLDADGGEVKTFEIVNGQMPPELAATKPKGSPRVQRWYKEGGTVSLDEDMNWTYTNSDGVRVKYIDGMPDFKTAGCVYDEQDVGRFRSRGSDRRRANREHGSKVNAKRYVWHHTGDGHTMQLVDREIHWQFKHYGGYSRMRRSMVRKTF